MERLKKRMNWKLRCGPDLHCTDSDDGATISFVGRTPHPVSMPGGGGGAVMVQVQNDGGAAGNSTTQCTFTYSIWPMTADIATDEPLATQRVPHVRRAGTPAIAGRKVGAVAGTFGLAFFDAATEQWRLLIAFNERDDANECPS